MRRITHYGKRDNLLHVETPLGIVNIRVGLRNAKGQRVESIELVPNRFAGHPEVWTDEHGRHIACLRFIESA